MSDRIAVMSRGRVEQIGTPEEIYDRAGEHLRRRVHRLGQPAAGHARRRRRRARAVVVLDSGARRRGRRPRPTPATGDPVTVMLRPERLTSSPTRRPTTGAASPASSRTSSSRAPTLRLIVDLADGTEVVATVDTDDDAADACAPATPSRCAGRPTRRTCCAAARRSSARRRPTSTRSQASLDGTEVATRRGRRRADRAAGAPLRPAGAADRRRRRRRAAAVVGGVLAAAGDGGGDDSGDAAATAVAGRPAAASARATPRCDILNWHGYIDPTEDGAVGTVDRFIEATGIAINYTRGLQRQQRGVQPGARSRCSAPARPIDSDIICPTNWMAARLMSLRLARPAAARPDPQLRQPRRPLPQPAVGPRGRVLPAVAGRDHRHRLQPRVTGRELTSINDLFDPEFNGKVGDAHRDARHARPGHARHRASTRRSSTEEAAFAGARPDRAGQRTTARSGASPATTTCADLESGELRGLHRLVRRRRPAAVDRPDIQFVIPEEGGMSWYDTMVIPKGAPNAVAAADVDGLRLRPGAGGPAHRLRAVRLAGQGRAGGAGQDGRRRRRPRREPAPVPRRRGRRPAQRRSPTCPTSSTPPITDRFLGITGG